MLVAILLMSIMTGITVINYHYLAMQRQVDTQLTECFLKQVSQSWQNNQYRPKTQNTQQ